jgi:hypothetical protein
MTGFSYLFRGYDVPEGFDMIALKAHTAPELTVMEGDRGPADVLITRWDGVYHIVLGERRYGPYRTAENAYRGISNGIHFILGKRSPMTFVHAGAVEIDRMAVIFPGRSRWGKSTLVASLVNEGCGYLSDEYAVVSAEGSVFPLSKPIRLRGNGEAHYSMPEGVSAPGGLPCGAVILTKYELGSTWRPEYLSRGNTVLEMLPSVLQSCDAPEQVLAALTALVRNAACYRSSRGDGQPTMNVLRSLGATVDLRQELHA